jgi:hypothetical protein
MFLKNLKIEQPCDLEIPLLGLDLKECKSVYNKDAHQFLLQHYSLYPSYGNRPDALQLMNGLRR